MRTVEIFTYNTTPKEKYDGDRVARKRLLHYLFIDKPRLLSIFSTSSLTLHTNDIYIQKLISSVLNEIALHRIERRPILEVQEGKAISFPGGESIKLRPQFLLFYRVLELDLRPGDSPIPHEKRSYRFRGGDAIGGQRSGRVSPGPKLPRKSLERALTKVSQSRSRRQ